jgi:phosphonate transport system substrate-binding protein
MKKVYLLFVIYMIFLSLTACDTFLNTYEVSYDADGGVINTNNTSPITEVNHGETIHEPGVNKEGYVLEGWYSDSSYNVHYDFSQPVYGDLKLYAKWELEEETTEYIAVLSDILAILEEAKTKEGYRIDGWYLDEALTKEINIEDYLSEEPSIYVKWVLDQHNVNYYYNGVIVHQESYVTGENVELLDGYTTDALQFEGIYLSDSFIIQLNDDFDMPAEDVNLYINMVEIPNELTIVFVPSRDPSEILMATANLPNLLSNELESYGYSNFEITVHVASSYEAAGEMLVNGTAQIGVIPAGVFAEYDTNGVLSMILAATRDGLTKDSDDPIDWNDGTLTEWSSTIQVPYYRGLIIAGPSTKGQAIADIVNNGGTPTWNDLADLNWCLRSPTSSSGYIYPNLWLQDNYGHTFEDVQVDGNGSVVTTSGYGDSMASLATEICDVGTFYGDARMHYVYNWTESYNRTLSIWEETSVIGVTLPIMNDGIAINTDELDEELISALELAFLSIIETIEGQEIFDIYSIQGFMLIDDSEYDTAKRVIDLLN